MPRRAWCLALPVFLTSSPLALTAGSLSPDRVSWSSMTLEARKLGLSTSSSITLELLETPQGESQFLEPDQPGDFARAESDEMVVMRVTNSFLGRHSDTRFWLDSGDARVLQRVLVETGKRPRYKAYRFTRDGAWELRKNPVEGEEELSHERWSKVRSELDSYPGWGKDLVVTESAGLFYIISASHLSQPGDQLVAHVVSKEQVYPIEIEVQEVGQVQVDFQASRGGHKTVVRRKVPALHLTLEPRPPEGVDASGFKLLGLEGAVHVWLDPDDRFPLRLSGKIPYAGQVNIELKSVQLGS